MSQIDATVTIPESLVQAFAEGHDPKSMTRWAFESLILTAVGEGIISTGHAADLLGIGYFQTLSLLKKRGVPNPMTKEDLEEEQAVLKTTFPDSFDK